MAKEHPIIFSTPMVQAILEGRKTQTRRIIKPQPPNGTLSRFKHNVTGALCIAFVTEKTLNHTIYCPYGQPGDVLWVRESFGTYKPDDGERPAIACGSDQPYLIHKKSKWKMPAVFKAGTENYAWGMYGEPQWKPSIHMPRSAARIFLKVENVRVERLQEITASECKKEGILIDPEDPDYIQWIGKFADLWDKINGSRAPWDSNPWVWVVEFSRISNYAR